MLREAIKNTENIRKVMDSDNNHTLNKYKVKNNKFTIMILKKK